ncbi:MAG: dUTP diphosphatase [Candidatus Peregrinibacteria bacterium]|nr:dUTP diphosphatase [Candidatus Peregrinibacteria bacterium]
MKTNVQIYRVDKTLPLPKHETNGSFAFDLLARETTEISPQEVVLIPGNVIVKCPKNLALLILPRSSTYRKTGLIFPHSVGLIDEDYCGENDEIMIQVLNLSKETITIERGERVAQGLFVKTEKIEFKEIETPHKISRGGFGSTD